MALRLLGTKGAWFDSKIWLAASEDPQKHWSFDNILFFSVCVLRLVAHFAELK